MKRKKKVTELKLICPFRIKSGARGKKLYSINLNAYTNWHFQLKNQLKRNYAAIMKPQLEAIEIETPVKVVYKVYKPSKRRLDKMNVVSVTSKFLMDAISDHGCWEDDNDDFIKTEVIMPTSLDRDEPRIEVYIKTIK